MLRERSADGRSLRRMVNLHFSLQCDDPKAGTYQKVEGAANQCARRVPKRAIENSRHSAMTSPLAVKNHAASAIHTIV